MDPNLYIDCATPPPPKWIWEDDYHDSAHHDKWHHGTQHDGIKMTSWFTLPTSIRILSNIGELCRGIRIQGPLVRATKAKYENSVQLWGLIYECVKAICPFTSLYILRQQGHNELRTSKSLPLALLNIQHGLDSWGCVFKSTIREVHNNLIFVMLTSSNNEKVCMHT